MNEPVGEIHVSEAQMRCLGTARVGKIYDPIWFEDGDPVWILSAKKRYHGTMLGRYGVIGVVIQVGVAWEGTWVNR